MKTVSGTNRYALKESRIGLLLAVPALIVFSLVVLYPFANSIIMSFTNRSLLRRGFSWVGIQNYVKIFSDPNFPQVLKNTAVFVLLGTLLPFFGGLIWAILLNQSFRSSGILRGITLVCWIIPSTAIGFIWMWIFHGHYGILNHILIALGISSQNIVWLGRPDTALYSVVAAKTWQTLPFAMAFILGALQAVNLETIESARIDGAGNMRVFWYVVLPEIQNVLTMLMLLMVIGSIQHFDLLWVMTEGGPARATTTLSIEVYNKAFLSFRLGEAASVGTIWTGILMVFGYFYLRRKTDY
jgi:multiple sugar transport system permease protein